MYSYLWFWEWLLTGKKGQNLVGIVVWKSLWSACAPCARSSQRQSHPYLLQPNHTTEVFIATGQLTVLVLQLAGIQRICWSTVILLLLVTKCTNAWKQCSWLLHEHPLLEHSWGILVFMAGREGKLQVWQSSLCGLCSSLQYCKWHMHMKGRPDTCV